MFMSVYIIYMGTMYTESTGALRDRSRKRVGKRCLKSLKGPKQHEERGHVMVCAEYPDLALLLPLIDLLCDLGQVTYPL